MAKALLLENIHQLGQDALRKAGYEIESVASALDEDELIEALDGVALLGIRSKTNVTSRVLQHAPDLMGIGAFCIGTNQIDLNTAAAHGIPVFNAPFSNTRSVVELTLAEIISLTRRMTERDRSLHAGVWNKTATGSHEVRGRTLGIVGYGNIGTQLSVVAEALGMRVIFYDSAEKLALGNAERMDSLDELLERADIVTLHVDGRTGNAGMFGADQFQGMKHGAIFLNLSRGFLVDYNALRKGILSGAIAGAGIDVFPEEPKANGDPFESQLRDLPNVILTPHVGGSTEEAQQDIGRFVAGKLRDYVELGSTALSVNAPTVAVDRPAQGVSRLAYLHRNVPGVMASINAVLSDAGVNIESQLLGTRGPLGYAVTDVHGHIDPSIISAIEALEPTIRARTV